MTTNPDWRPIQFLGKELGVLVVDAGSPKVEGYRTLIWRGSIKHDEVPSGINEVLRRLLERESFSLDEAAQREEADAYAETRGDTDGEHMLALRCKESWRRYRSLITEKIRDLMFLRVDVKAGPLVSVSISRDGKQDDAQDSLAGEFTLRVDKPRDFSPLALEWALRRHQNPQLQEARLDGARHWDKLDADINGGDPPRKSLVFSS